MDKKYRWGYTPRFDMFKHCEHGIRDVFGQIWRFAENDSGKCFASLERIAEETGYTRMTVIRAIRVLKLAGFIIDLTPGVRNRPHEYIIDYEAVETLRLTVEKQQEAKREADRNTEILAAKLQYSNYTPGVTSVDSTVKSVDSESITMLLEDSNKRVSKRESIINTDIPSEEFSTEDDPFEGSFVKNAFSVDKIIDKATPVEESSEDDGWGETTTWEESPVASSGVESTPLPPSKKEEDEWGDSLPEKVKAPEDTMTLKEWLGEDEQVEEVPVEEKVAKDVEDESDWLDGFSEEEAKEESSSGASTRDPEQVVTQERVVHDAISEEDESPAPLGDEFIDIYSGRGQQLLKYFGTSAEYIIKNPVRKDVFNPVRYDSPSILDRENEKQRLRFFDLYHEKD